jgi:hypothetical protein
MARFFGKVGYGHTVETEPGIHELVITEYDYYGDVVRNSRQLREADKVNDDISVTSSISIMADQYANDHFHAIRFVEWMGALWKVAEVTPERPRLVLRLGGVYNGPRATGSSDEESEGATP